MRCSLGLVTTIVVLAAAPLYAQQAPLPTVTPPPGLKATVLVTETQVTGVPDKVSRLPLGRPQTAVTQCVRKQNACGNLMMIIGHSQAGKWR